MHFFFKDTKKKFVSGDGEEMGVFSCSDYFENFKTIENLRENKYPYIHTTLLNCYYFATFAFSISLSLYINTNVYHIMILYIKYCMHNFFLNYLAVAAITNLPQNNSVCIAQK